MKRERITEGSPWNDPRGQVMKTPDDMAEMMRLRACGWGVKRIARQLGCSHHTVKDYVAAGGVKPFKSPERPKRLDGLEGWLRERLIRHRGNADVVRQDLLAEKGVAVSRRTLQRSVQPYRQALKAEALATTRFETPPGRQLQIDFGASGRDRRGESQGIRVRGNAWTLATAPCACVPGREAGALVRRAREHVHDLQRCAGGSADGQSTRACRAPRRGEPVGSVQRQADSLRKTLGLPSSRVRAISGAHEGQDGERRRLREEERDRRSFLSWEAFEAHLDRWEREVANVRIHGTTGEAPIIRFARDEIHRLKPLGEQPPFGSLRELTRVVGNDCAVEIDTNSYSVPWRLIGERVAVTIAAGEVRIRHGVHQVAVHEQSKGRRLRIVDPVHLDGVAGRNGAVRRPETAAAVPGSSPPHSLLRPLTEYEAVIGGSF